MRLLCATVLRRCALADWPPALERRRLAAPYPGTRYLISLAHLEGPAGRVPVRVLRSQPMSFGSLTSVLARPPDVRSGALSTEAANSAARPLPLRPES